MKPKITNIEKNLQNVLSGLKSAIVAYSGGVDSSYLMDVANQTLGSKSLAVMSFSPSVAEDDRNDAINLAKNKNWNYKIINTLEMDDENYVKNDINRCFFCKHELYGQLVELSNQLGFDWVLNGSNLDDKGDYRPGMNAAKLHKVRSPLIETEFTKEDIRYYAKKRNLRSWDRPASPCLSSRLPYGTMVTVEALTMVGKSEQFLKSIDFPIVRVRHYGEKALIEIPKDKFSYFNSKIDNITRELNNFGYKTVELDPVGFRSGSLNHKVGIKNS